MSWDLSIKVPGCERCGRGEDYPYERNYTHNCNAMIRAASIHPFPHQEVSTFAEVILRAPTTGECWGDYNDKPAKEAGAFASRIADELERDPEKYRPMQPENGWGSYDTVIELCRAVARACAEYPEGTFQAHG